MKGKSIENPIKKSYYKLFSINLLRFIKAHGYRAVSKGVHENGRTYWIFDLSEEGLDQVLARWTAMKQEQDQKNCEDTNKNTEWKVGHI